MTADHDTDEGSQRTVAQLLAQYGEGAATGRRRARRRAEETDDQPPEAPSGVNGTESESSLHQLGEAAPRRHSAWPAPGSSEDGPTQRLPRLANGHGAEPAGPGAALDAERTVVVGSPALLDGSEIDSIDIDVAANGVGSAEPAEQVDGQLLDEPASGTTAWLAMVAQWIGGAIGGAALWVAFRFLWSEMPVVALVAAVLVIAGLVLLVRAIRRSDDLKTTVFAVLVGLVVTVSPAVLVLVTR